MKPGIVFTAFSLIVGISLMPIWFPMGVYNYIRFMSYKTPNTNSQPQLPPAQTITNPPTSNSNPNIRMPEPDNLQYQTNPHPPNWQSGVPNIAPVESQKIQHPPNLRPGVRPPLAKPGLPNIQPKESQTIVQPPHVETTHPSSVSAPQPRSRQTKEMCYEVEVGEEKKELLRHSLKWDTYGYATFINEKRLLTLNAKEFASDNLKIRFGPDGAIVSCQKQSKDKFLILTITNKPRNVPIKSLTMFNNEYTPRFEETCIIENAYGEAKYKVAQSLSTYRVDETLPFTYTRDKLKEEIKIGKAIILQLPNENFLFGFVESIPLIGSTVTFRKVIKDLIFPS